MMTHGEEVQHIEVEDDKMRMTPSDSSIDSEEDPLEKRNVDNEPDIDFEGTSRLNISRGRRIHVVPVKLEVHATSENESLRKTASEDHKSKFSSFNEMTVVVDEEKQEEKFDPVSITPMTVNSESDASRIAVLREGYEDKFESLS